jgi:hypothetical protein
MRKTVIPSAAAVIPSAAAVIPSAARNLHLLLFVASVAQGQTLASRVERAPDGVVRLQVASRAGVCGDGKDVIGFGHVLFARNFQSYGRWSVDNCSPGPLRITISKVDGDVTRARTQVGGAWPSTELTVTDVGVVAPSEASAYFLSLVPRLERTGKDRVLIPVVLADADPPLGALIALARNDDRHMDTRRSAIHWIGQLGDDTVLGTLEQLARSDDDEDGLSGSALAALSMLEGPAGDAAAKWMIARALDQNERRQLRKNALFWAGQHEDTPTADLVRVYNTGSATDLREHAIFVLSQRRDRAATDALLRIAQEDADTRMRGKALFWLAQKDDARVKKLIADIILKP